MARIALWRSLLRFLVVLTILVQSATANCVPADCLNGGTCFNLTATISTCVCPLPYLAPTCAAAANYCNTLQPDKGINSFPVCLNNGTCSMSYSDPYFTCSCLTGYSGTRCDILPTTTSISTAIDSTATGDMATTPSTSTTTTPSATTTPTTATPTTTTLPSTCRQCLAEWIVIGILVVIIIIVTVLFIIIHCECCRKRCNCCCMKIREPGDTCENGNATEHGQSILCVCPVIECQKVQTAKVSCMGHSNVEQSHPTKSTKQGCDSGSNSYGNASMLDPSERAGGYVKPSGMEYSSGTLTVNAEVHPSSDQEQDAKGKHKRKHHKHKNHRPRPENESDMDRGDGEPTAEPATTLNAGNRGSDEDRQ